MYFTVKILSQLFAGYPLTGTHSLVSTEHEWLILQSSI